jgi:hypothetical protein
MIRAAALLLSIATCSWSCSGSQPPQQQQPAGDAHPSAPPVTRPGHLTVVDIRLQRAADETKPVPEIVEVLKRGERLAIAVVTQGSVETAEVAARVLRDGRVVTEGRTQFAPTGTTSTRFEVTPPDGWAPGRYTVQILLDGTPAGERQFNVVPD